MKKFFSLRRQAKKLLKVTVLILTTATRNKRVTQGNQDQRRDYKTHIPLVTGRKQGQQVNYMSEIFSKAKTLHQQQPGS